MTCRQSFAQTRETVVSVFDVVKPIGKARWKFRKHERHYHTFKARKSQLMMNDSPTSVWYDMQSLPVGSDHGVTDFTPVCFMHFVVYHTASAIYRHFCSTFLRFRYENEFTVTVTMTVLHKTVTVL
jgi:hypothetical protein